jgi:HK97 family phage major capsid protein
MLNNALYNAIALNHAKKQGGEKLADLNKILAEKNTTVEKLLNMNALDFVQKNANEVLGETNTGFGKEWVEEVILSAELIERLQANDSLLVGATIKLMEGKSLDVPVKGKKVRMSLTTELLNAPTGGSTNATQVKKLGTPKITLNANEMKITIYYSDTLLEDSVVAMAEYVMSEIADAYETSIHEVLLNGDTATGANTNINIIDANTSALPDGDKTDLLSANGIRKLAFTNSATVDAGGNLAVENIRSARAKMGVKGLDPSKLRLVPDMQTYQDLLNLTEVETIEKFGASATITNGTLSAIDGIKIVNREEMLRATANGKISATPANNTK